MRCTLQLIGGNREVNSSVQQYIDQENEMGFHAQDNGVLMKSYQERINQGKKEYRRTIDELKRQGKRIVGYGASATSTTLIYHYEMGNDFEFLVDDFEAKQGLFSPGMHIPVFPSTKIYEDPPDVIVVLAWRYHEKIVARHKEFLDAGGTFIIPLPEIKILAH